MLTGRFAPSPTGDLHLGNLRTAVIAWLAARAAGGRFIVRMEDLDLVQANPDNEQRQLRDLAMIGIDWDGEVVRQSERFDLYAAAIEQLAASDLVYECYCTRREIRDEIEASVSAPHGPPGAYPGTCRELTVRQRSDRAAEGRRPALRLRGGDRSVTFTDALAGEVRGVVDDVVLRRNDGVPAYNLAVVVDDARQGVTQVVRGDDLLTSTPRQIALQELLGLTRPAYAHVPLVIDHEGNRLAKRRAMAVTLADLAARGVGTADVVEWIVASFGGDVGSGASVVDLVPGFDVASLPRDPVVAPPWVDVPT